MARNGKQLSNVDLLNYIVKKESHCFGQLDDQNSQIEIVKKKIIETLDNRKKDRYSNFIWFLKKGVMSMINENELYRNHILNFLDNLNNHGGDKN